MNQLLLGASVPFVVGTIIYLLHRCRASVKFLVLLPIAMLIGMLWAVAPDIPRLFGFEELYARLYRDPRCDLFMWHYTIDRLESELQIYNVLFVAMLACLLCTAVRELSAREKGL